jgi:malate dehydrogenase (oxaloacetate-decarboxylating)
VAARVADAGADDLIGPSPFDPRVGQSVSAAVAEAARQDGVARA